MSELFLTLVNRSLAACWLILAILLLRPFLRKVSHAISCALWSLVAIRLLCPFSIQSILSLVPKVQPIPSDFTMLQPTGIDGGVPTVGQTIETPVLPTTPPAGSETVSSVSLLPKIVVAVWLIGIAAFAVYLLGSYLRLRLRVRVREAVKQEGGYWFCDRIDAPFVIGIFRPRILLPYTVEKNDIPYILAHEKAHLARHDHWRKAIGFMVLAVFWFQPLLWIAFFLLCRDIEFACDERVIRSLGSDAQSKKDYAEALVRGTFPSVSVIACPLAFGGLRIKQRVHSVVKYKKPAAARLLAAILVCCVVAVCFLTDPRVGADSLVNVPENTLESFSPETEKPTEESPVKPPVTNTASSWRDQYKLAEAIVTPVEPCVLDGENANRLAGELTNIDRYFMESSTFDEETFSFMILLTNERDIDCTMTYLVYDAPYLYGTEIITILLPAGQKVVYDFGRKVAWVPIGASYGDASVQFPLRAYMGG